MIAHRTPSPPEPSSDLVRRAQSGDHAALVDLLKPYEEKVFRLACRMSPQVEDAEDMAQDALARIVARLPAFRGECAFATWVYRVAVNVCLTERSRRRIPTLPLGDPDLVDPAPGPQESAELHALGRRIDAEIGRLPPIYRDALLLRLIEELSYEEMAAMLGLSINTVRQRVYRGLKRLRERLQPWLSEERIR